MALFSNHNTAVMIYVEVVQMTDAKFSDIDKQVYPKDECYQVAIKSPENAHLDFDIHKSQRGESIENAMKLALQNGVKWYKLVQDENKKWKRQEVPNNGED